MDPVDDTMSDRLEEFLRDRMLALSTWADIKVCFRGEPVIVPTTLMPFGVVFMTLIGEAKGEDGQTDDTGFRRWRYDGFISVEDLIPDVQASPVVDRKLDIPSYKSVKRYIQAAWRSVSAWAGPDGELDGDPVVSYDGLERTVELRMDRVQNGIQTRGDDSVMNVATFSFHVFTRRQNPG